MLTPAGKNWKDEMLTTARRRPLQHKFIEQIIEREGSRYTDHPADKGGPTKFGVTLEAYQNYLGDPTADANCVRGLQEDVARRILIEGYFNGFGFERIENEMAYGFILDCSVNHGQKGAVLILQRAVGTKQDGSLGPITARAVNKQTHEEIMSNLIRERGRWFANIVERDASQIVFIEGWLSRLHGFLPY